MSIMAKKDIEQLKTRKRVLLLRARRSLAEAIEIDERIEKMRTGKLKAPLPPAKAVRFTMSKDGDVEFDDLVPSFGSSPAFGG